MQSKLAPTIAALILLAQPARGGCGSIPMPPPEYDHPPLGTTILGVEDLGDVGRTCASMGFSPTTLTGNDPTTLGCSWRSGAIGHVLIAADLPIELMACGIRHEWAHLNGWPAWHPNARFES